MQFFIDSADVKEIQALLPTGFVDGVTTNPSLIAMTGRPFRETIAEICEIVPGPVSAEVMGKDENAMIEEGLALREIAENVVVKVPMTPAGLRACYALAQQEIAVNVTLVFSAMQALLAAKAGAAFVSPFMGRLDDIGQDSTQLMHDICEIFDQYEDLDTYVLAASIRGPHHVQAAAQAGADFATIPPKVLWQMYQHPLTDQGLARFEKDWVGVRP